MMFWELFFGFASNHPVAAFFLIMAVGWSIGSVIKAVLSPWRDEVPNVNIQKNTESTWKGSDD